MNSYFVYDIETYPNVFTVAVLDFQTGDKWLFEMSDRRDDTVAFLSFMVQLSTIPNCYMVGFNNVGFDYPIIHKFCESEGNIGYAGAYEICQDIIVNDNGFEHTVWDDKRLVPQLDLYLINHFNNRARRTGLKQIEFNMRVTNLQDLPFPPGTTLTSDQIDQLIYYNMEGDVVNTAKFLEENLEAINFRETFGVKWMNYNDTKIGKQYFIQELESQGIQCFNHKAPIQTHRSVIDLAEAVRPWITFQHPEFQRVLEWFKQQKITETKGIFSDVSCTVDGFQYDFGLGGIHGSVESQTVESDDYWIVEDWDVASYYPNLAIANRLFPAHLGEGFCDVYQDVYNQRKKFAKGTPENAAMKLALNGVYGDSNSKFSPFYDPLYTMSITINGQLLLCLLAETLIRVPELTMIQINTDGLTIRYPRKDQASVHAICKWWEGCTHLELESAEYKRMFIRDVNNYIAVGVDGKVKRKGAYEYERGHHQNHSALVVPKATEIALLHSVPVEDAVYAHTDLMDYCLKVKAPVLELDGVGQQRTCRYYVSKTGGTLRAIKPPPAGMRVGDFKKAQGVSNAAYTAVNQTGVHNPEIHTKNMSVYGHATSEVEKGWKVTVCNHMGHAVAPIDYSYYIDRVRKLVEPMR